MSTPTVPEHFPTTWDNSWKEALQTSDARMTPGADTDTCGGDRKWYNIGGTVTFKRKTARYETTSYVNYSTSKSWLYPTEWDAPILQDEWDDEFLDSIAVPTSRIMQDQVAGYTRLRDQFVRDAVEGTRTTGEDGDTTEAFPTSTNEIAVAYQYGGGGSDSGLTWDKVRRAKVLQDTLRVPIGPQRFFAVSTYQVEDLRSMAQATDRDYANTQLILSGEIHGTYWAGYTWLQYEDLSYDAGDADARQCLAWHKMDIVLAESAMRHYVDVLPTRSHALQIRPSVKLGSCRVKNSSLIINCLEA